MPEIAQTGPTGSLSPGQMRTAELWSQEMPRPGFYCFNWLSHSLINGGEDLTFS